MLWVLRVAQDDGSLGFAARPNQKADPRQEIRFFWRRGGSRIRAVWRDGKSFGLRTHTLRLAEIFPQRRQVFLGKRDNFRVRVLVVAITLELVDRLLVEFDRARHVILVEGL